jgi:hypothetical protein
MTETLPRDGSHRQGRIRYATPSLDKRTPAKYGLATDERPFQ